MRYPSRLWICLRENGMISATYDSSQEYCDHLMSNIYNLYGQDKPIFLFYDINCQYKVHFKVFDRLLKYRLG